MRPNAVGDAVRFADIYERLARLFWIITDKALDTGSRRFFALQGLADARAWSDQYVTSPIHDLGRDDAGGRPVYEKQSDGAPDRFNHVRFPRSSSFGRPQHPTSGFL